MGFLFLGIAFFLLGVLFSSTGMAWGRFGSVTYRAENPKKFWGNVIVLYLLGVLLIGLFLYETYWP